MDNNEHFNYKHSRYWIQSNGSFLVFFYVSARLKVVHNLFLVNFLSHNFLFVCLFDWFLKRFLKDFSIALVFTQCDF